MFQGVLTLNGPCGGGYILRGVGILIQEGRGKIVIIVTRNKSNPVKYFCVCIDRKTIVNKKEVIIVAFVFCSIYTGSVVWK